MSVLMVMVDGYVQKSQIAVVADDAGWELSQSVVVEEPGQHSEAACQTERFRRQTLKRRLFDFEENVEKMR
jgi:hypothetical protein